MLVRTSLLSKSVVLQVFNLLLLCSWMVVRLWYLWYIAIGIDSFPV